MRTMKAARAILLGSGALLLVLGIIIWIGNGDRLVGVHVALGVVLVLTLWYIAVLAARAGAPTGTVVFAASWGVVVMALGVVQEELVPGDLHWTVQVLHVAVSMGAIWWGKRLLQLAGQAQARRAPRPVQGVPA